jgi:hypothetical protein
MANQPMRGVAGAALCLALTAGTGLAQQYPQTRGYPAPQANYQAAATIVGTYKSDDFFPSPLTLTITGMDAAGNLSGSIGGMRTTAGGIPGQDPSWERWERVFGRDGMRASYRGGRVLVQFPGGAYYDLELKGNTLTGTYAESATFSRNMTFIKAGGVAAR